MNAKRKLPMNLSVKHLNTLVAFMLCCLLAMSVPVMAETDSDEDGWTFGASAYLWAAGVEGTSSQGDDIDVSFSDIAKDLDGAIMGIIGAQNGKWALVADLIYMNINQETSTTANSIGLPQKIDTDVTLQAFVSTFFVAYRVFEGEKSKLDLVAGARYIYMDVELDGAINSNKVKSDDSDYALDGIVGFEGKVQLNDRWYASLYADAGTGDSKLTWQAWPGVGYTFENFDVVAGYRHLKWETDDGEAIDDVSFSGPMLGMKFYF